MKKDIQTIIEKCQSENPKEKPSFSELFNKLGLSKYDIFDLGNNVEQNVIDYEFDMEHNHISHFCLYSVNYEEVLEYVNEINVTTKMKKKSTK